MRRFVTLAVLLLFSIPFGVSISGCAKTAAPVFCNGGDSGITTGQVTSITLTPIVYGISLNYAEIGQISSPSAADCKGSTASAGNYAYGTTDMTIADVQPSSGRVCAGTWNRNSGGGIPDFTYCIPTNKSGTAYISASAGGVTSNPLPIFVHPVVTSIVLGGPSSNCATDPTTACCPLATVGAVTAPPYLANSCLSQGTTAQLVARVFAPAGDGGRGDGTPVPGKLLPLPGDNCPVGRSCLRRQRDESDQHQLSGGAFAIHRAGRRVYHEYLPSRQHRPEWRSHRQPAGIGPDHRECGGRGQFSGLHLHLSADVDHPDHARRHHQPRGCERKQSAGAAGDGH